jgi:hypothetical protein
MVVYLYSAIALWRHNFIALWLCIAKKSESYSAAAS